MSSAEQQRRFEIGLVAEDKSDALRATFLADRVLLEAHPYLEGQDLDWHRRWVGLESSRDSEFTEGHFFLKTGSVLKVAKADPRMPRKFHGSGSGDVRSARVALALFRRAGITAVLWVRDTDVRASERAEEIEKAAAAEADMDCAWGLPREAMEAWILVGFSPQDDREEAVLKQLRQRLGFDPTREPESLSHKDPHPKSVKQVFGELTAHRADADADCLSVQLGTLRLHGLGCGLTAFLERVDKLFRAADLSS